MGHRSVRKRWVRSASHSKSSLVYIISLSLVAPLIALFAQHTFASQGLDRVKRITLIVEALKNQLGIPNLIEVNVVDGNRLGFSSERGRQPGTFLISADAQLLNELDDETLTAALAHEMGHIWIYTHHPYLQTEALANHIAMRVVSRDALKRLYAKLWAFKGTSGDIDALLGPQAGN